jgi:AcrR family transcriptional regulator
VPDALTMRALAKAVGVDHRALYRHYPDRDAVLAAVAAEGYRQLLSISNWHVSAHRAAADGVRGLCSASRSTVRICMR